MSLDATLRRAARLHARIETLRGELTRLLAQASAEAAAMLLDEVPTLPRRRGRPKMLRRTAHRKQGRGRSPLLGVKRAASPSGPLAPAVVAVLKAKRKPMGVTDILTVLLAKGYKFNAAEPRKNLAARIYRLKGVRQVSAGLFATS